MKSDQNIEAAVLQFVQSENYRPLKPKAIAKKLKLQDDERGVKRALKKLVKDGKLTWGPKHLVHLVLQAEKKVPRDEVVGIFRRASAGYGFVTPLDSTASDRSDDIYVPIEKTGDATDGDTVRIRVSRRRQGPEIRTSGRVLEIVERRTNRFIGSYQEEGRHGFVHVDSGIFETPILVGDAGAKNCRPGDVVVIEIARFPTLHHSGEGVIVEVLGDRGQPGVDTLSIIREYNLPESFSERVLDSARQQAVAFDESIGQRTDFTTSTVITIDPKTARDFDDAISLEQTDNGHWILGVHIADVSHFVPTNSPLDDEAYQRGTSVYLPDRVIPMLPELISNNLASLQPDRVRYCMTAIIEFDSRGVPIATDMYRGAIKSAYRFDYEQIDEYLADDGPWRKELSPAVFQLVRDMHTLAMILRRRRLDRGAIELTLPEVEIDLDDDGKVAGAHTRENTESHQIIEEFMLAANEAVARKLMDRGLHFLRRIHEPPSPTKLKELTRFMHQMGIECDSLESRFEIKRIAETSVGRPEAKAIHYSILRSMQKAVYSPKEAGHYALHSDAYCHFTSPIRRYPDLVIHRMIGQLIDGEKPDSNFERLSVLGNHCSRLEQRAESAERELTKIKLLNYFAERIGHQMESVITGVEPFGLFAQGIEIPAEGLIPIANLPDDHYHFDRSARLLSGYHGRHQFRLGDVVTVRVAHVDLIRRELELMLVEDATRRKGRRPRTRQAQSGRGERPAPRVKPSRRDRDDRPPRSHETAVQTERGASQLPSVESTTGRFKKRKRPDRFHRDGQSAESQPPRGSDRRHAAGKRKSKRGGSSEPRHEAKSSSRFSRNRPLQSEQKKNKKSKSNRKRKL